jgi:hypothetical protein
MKEVASRFHAGFLLGPFFDPEDGGDVFSKRRLTLNGLYGVVSQKTELVNDPCHSFAMQTKYFGHYTKLQKMVSASSYFREDRNIFYCRTATLLV